MSWLSDLAGRAENLLNNIDEQTGAVLRNHAATGGRKRFSSSENVPLQRRKSPSPKPKKNGVPLDSKPNGVPAKTWGPRNTQTRFSKEIQVSMGQKKSPSRKKFDVDDCPKTLVNDFPDCMPFKTGLRKRRNSFPSEIENSNNQEIAYKMQNMEIENAMLKNELNVVNKEVFELLERLGSTEEELTYVKEKLSNSEKSKRNLEYQNDSLNKNLECITSQSNINNSEISKHKEQSLGLEFEMNLLSSRNKDLEGKVLQLEADICHKDASINKLEKDLRHAQTSINELKENLEKVTAENQSINKDWQAYKLRVKNMLVIKDNEILKLKEGSNLTEDTKLLMEQLESLQEEREQLSNAVSCVREDGAQLRSQISQLELRSSNAERVASALRDALKEERTARNKAEASCVAMSKELQSFQMQANQTIADLRSALHEKDEEINNLMNTTSSIPTSDTSTLNVADYDGQVENDKIQGLTQTLIQKQGKIEALMADNNILRIQLDKLESKYKTELAAIRAKYSHVVHLQDGDSRLRSRNQDWSPLTMLALKFGVMIKRFPVFRTFIFIYMIGLHMWVLTVLFASTPDTYVPKPTRV